MVQIEKKFTDLESTSKLRLYNWSQLATFCKPMHLFDVKSQNTGSKKRHFFENPIRD